MENKRNTSKEKKKQNKGYPYKSNRSKKNGFKSNEVNRFTPIMI